MKLVEINFGGVAKKQYKLKFGVKAFTQIEEISGKPIGDMNMEKMETVFILVTAGLRWADNKITVDKVMDMVDKWSEKVAEEEGLSFFEAMGKVMEQLSNLLGEAMGTGGTTPNEKD